jgi:hypothetical protein
MISVFVTGKEYREIEECRCGGPVFKVHNTSKNEFVAKCGYFKKIIEIDRETKRKVWITPKKASCGWRVVYPGERPVFKELNKVLVKSVQIDKRTIHEQLEEKLKILFKFLHVSNHSSTLDEINILVTNNLLKEPKNDDETFEDYEKRIFAKKILDVSHRAILPKIETAFKFYDLPCLRRTPSPKTPPQKEKRTVSQFVEVEAEAESESDNETDRETEVESDNESRQDTEEDFDRDQSDFESVFDDPVEDIEDNYEDDAPDYYDD